MVIADVSGKGVPAALFMMTAKTLVQNEAMSNRSSAAVLEAVNHQIFVNNKEQMFGTDRMQEAPNSLTISRCSVWIIRGLRGNGPDIYRHKTKQLTKGERT